MGVMEVELLVVRECPHTVGAAQLLRTALDDIGLPDIDFRTTTIVSQADAERRGFRGSPTFFADGTDIFRDPGVSLGSRAGFTGRRTRPPGFPISSTFAGH